MKKTLYILAVAILFSAWMLSIGGVWSAEHFASTQASSEAFCGAERVTSS